MENENEALRHQHCDPLMIFIHYHRLAEHVHSARVL